MEKLRPPATLAPELLALLAAVEDGRDSVASLASDAAGAATVRAGLTELELLRLVRRSSAVACCEPPERRRLRGP